MAAAALRVVYADAALLVVDKPAGLLSVPGRSAHGAVCNAATLLARWAIDDPGALAAARDRASAFSTVEALKRADAGRASETAAEAAAAPDRLRRLRRGDLPWTTVAHPPPAVPLGVHRLDEATSGLLVFGLTYPMQRALALQFAGDAQAPSTGAGADADAVAACGKLYEAVVDTRAAEVAAALGAAAAGAPAGGRPHPLSALLADDEGVITTPLRRHNHLPLLQVPQDGGEGDPAGRFQPGARACVTRWRVLERGDGAARLALTPLTGRTHQLRLHCALPPPWGLGCPIVGDSFYGDPALAQSPYLAELLRRAAELRPAAPGGADAFVTSVDLLAQDAARRAALLAAARRDGTMPALDSCALLPPHRGGAARAPIAPVPRLLLHARELAVPDAFHYAGRSLEREAWAAARGPPPGVAAPAPRFRPRRRAGGGAAAADIGGSGAPSPPLPPRPPENRALDAALAAGSGLWDAVAPWTVVDASPRCDGAVRVGAEGGLCDAGEGGPRGRAADAPPGSGGGTRVVTFIAPTPF